MIRVQKPRKVEEFERRTHFDVQGVAFPLVLEYNPEEQTKDRPIRRIFRKRALRRFAADSVWLTEWGRLFRF